MNLIPLARFAATAARTARGPLPAPYKLTFCVTQRCNLRCRTCHIWRARPEGELSLDEIERFFRANPSLQWVDLTGGEITLRPDVEGIVEAAVRGLPRLFQFHFPTNGTLPHRAVRAAARAKAAGVPKVVVSVSVDGPPQLHDSLRGRDGVWERAVETYRALRAVPGVEVYFGMTISKDNVGEVFSCIQALRRRIPSLTPSDLHLNVAHASFYYRLDRVDLPEVAQVEEVLARFRKARGFPSNPVLLLELLYQRHVPRYLRTGKSPIPCQALSSSLFVDSAGKVYPCASFEAPLGTIRETDYSLAPLWTQRATVSLRERIRQGRCPGCWTPCEAYQSIIAGLLRPSTWRRG